MYTLPFLLLILSSKLIMVASSGLVSNLILGENLFINLYSDPFLDSRFSEFSKQYIDEKVESFLNLMKEKGGMKHSLQRRSINEKQENDIYMLEEFNHLDVLENVSCIDAVLFDLDDTSYMATLEIRSGIKLGLYKYNEKHFQLISETSTDFARRIYATVNNKIIFLVVVEDLRIHIYQVYEETVRKIQTLEVAYVSNINLWNNKYGFFMGVARSNTHLGMSYIYKWFGRHFDFVDKLESSAATSIEAFTIGSSEFIAITNSQDDYGQTEIYSSIFKYNVDTERYEINQKIATNNATKAAFVSFFQNGIKGHFLVIINANKGKKPHNCVIYKFVDNYFMPYEGIILNHPLDIVVISTPNQKQQLGIFSQTSGLKIYSYDGWIFDELETKNSLVGVSSIKSATFAHKNVLLVGENNEVKIYEPIFMKKDDTKSIESNMMNWCEVNLNQLQSASDKKGKQIDEIVTRENAESNEGEEYDLNIVKNNPWNSEIQAIRLMNSELNKEFQKLKEIEKEISTSFLSTREKFVIVNDILLEHLVVNGNIMLKGLQTNTINQVLISPLLNTKIDLKFLDEIDNLNFQNVLINNFPNFLNGKPSDILLNINDIMNTRNLFVKGNVTVENKMISGRINDVLINESNILLDEIPQTFDKNFEVINCETNNVVITGSINGKACNDEEVNKVENLNVENLTVSNYINNVPITTGDQNLTKPFIFDTVITNEINIDMPLSTVFDSDVIFDNIEINDLNIIRNMNNIEVKLITSRGDDETAQPVFIQETLSVPDGTNIEGSIFVQNMLSARNIKSLNSSFGLGDINEEALKLDDIKFNGSIIFSKIAVDNINTSFINKMSPNDFISNEDSFFVTGPKVIDSDIYFHGHTKVLNVNDVPIKEFQDKVLNIFEDQTLDGKYYINAIMAESVSCSNVNLGNENVPRDMFKVNPTVYTNSLEIKHSHIHNLKLSKINNKNIDDTLNDVMRNGGELHGNRTVRKMFANNVYSKNEFNMDMVPRVINAFKTNFLTEENLRIPNIAIEHIQVQGCINEIESTKFKKEWMRDAVEQQFGEKHSFRNATILGKTTIRTNHINNFKLDDLFENTVKTDENHTFVNAIFDKRLIVFESINLTGNIVGLDLDSAVTFSDTKCCWIIPGPKTFESMVLVNGSLVLNRNVNSMRIKNLCDMLSNKKLSSLIVNGSVVFSKTPRVDKVNGLSIIDYTNNIWQKNRPVNLTGYFKFQNITFQDDLQIEGLINNIDLGNLESNYFSKSKNQTIFSHLDFTGNVNFFDGLKAKEMLLGDSISGVRLNDIISKTLLDGYTQVFEDPLYVDDITVQALNGNYLFNNVDLQRQVMRYDKENFMVGAMNATNVTINNLIIRDNLLIEKVDILKWLERAVLKHGGSLEFCNFVHNVVFSKELGVVGRLNGNKFNNKTVLLGSTPQTISENIFFNSTAIYLKTLGLQTLNGIDLHTFMKEMISNNKDVKIKSPVAIEAPITTSNLEINQLYNGVNVTDLLNNLVSFNFENFYGGYDQLLNISKQIQSSLDSYPMYLNHYKLLQTLSDVTYADVFHNHLVTISFDNNRYSYKLYAWNTVMNMLNEIYASELPDLKNITFIEKIEIGVQSYLYMEDLHFGYITKLSEDNSFEFVDKLEINGTHSLHNFQIVERNLLCIIFMSNQNSRIYCKANGEGAFFLLQTFKSMGEASSLKMNGETFLVTSAWYKNENYVTIWQYNNLYGIFTEVQHVYVAFPCSISTISFRNSHYLAIASGNIEDAIHSGSVQIKWFHPGLQMFVSYQAISIDSPVQVQFKLLPSDELMLYILTESASGSFFVYQYEGIFGLSLKHSINMNARVTKIVNVNQEHLILATNTHYLKIIQGIFKRQSYG